MFVDDVIKKYKRLILQKAKMIDVMIVRCNGK